MNSIDTIIQKYKEFSDFEVYGPNSEEVILAAEKKLGLNFSPQHKYFLKNYGEIDSFNFYILGLKNSVDWTNNDMVGQTLILRYKFWKLSNIITITKLDTGQNISLDYSKVSTNSEPQVIIHFEDEYKEVIAQNLLEYLNETYEKKQEEYINSYYGGKTEYGEVLNKDESES